MSHHQAKDFHFFLKTVGPLCRLIIRKVSQAVSPLGKNTLVGRVRGTQNWKQREQLDDCRSKIGQTWWRHNLSRVRMVQRVEEMWESWSKLMCLHQLYMREKKRAEEHWLVITRTAGQMDVWGEREDYSILDILHWLWAIWVKFALYGRQNNAHHPTPRFSHSNPWNLWVIYMAKETLHLWMN